MDLELPNIDNPAAVTSLAFEVESVGTRTFDLVSSAQETWYNLSGTYRAPEAEAVYSGMREPLTFISALQVSTKLVKRALDEHAAKLVDFHVCKAQLEVEIMAAQLAMARALAMPRTKTERSSDGENEEVPSEEREEAIADFYDRETGHHWLRIDGAIPNSEHPTFNRNPAKSELPMKHIELRDKNLSEVKGNALDLSLIHI